MGSCYAKKAVEIVKNEWGYQCGDNKWNKFADELDKVDFFTGCGLKQNLDFCALGLCWSIFKAVIDPSSEEDAEAAKWVAHWFMYQSDSCDMAAVVKYLYQYFADNGAVTDNPERGDFVIFQKSNGIMYHCGMVTDWDWKNDSIEVTEFNTGGGQVLPRYYSFKDIGGKIKCFCRPRYDGWEEPKAEKPVDDVKPEKPSEPSKPEGKQYAVSVTSWLNVRHGAGTNYPVVDKLFDGDIVTVYEIKDGWGRISNDMDIWVCMDYLN